MNKLTKYYGVIIFAVVILIVLAIGYFLLAPKFTAQSENKASIETKTEELEKKQEALRVLEVKIKRIQNSISESSKKIYSPIESDLGNDTLFFTLYNDLIEMLHANSVKIKSIDYTYNPQEDEFVKFGKDVYFVCDVKMELVSNYVNLGKFIEDIYQYPYYIKINDVEIKPYPKDKKILLADVSLRLYAHTAPTETDLSANVESKAIAPNN